MTDKYTGQAMDRRYTGDEADVTYSLKRCIHAEECVHRLAQVFDVSKRPWINPGGTTSDALSETVKHCPSGALHVDRKDGVMEDPQPDNTIRLWQNGPLQFTGDLQIQGATVDVQHETRATLCRCGASQNKPFCDNSHRTTGFQATDVTPSQSNDGQSTASRQVVVTAQPNGPYKIDGLVTIVNAADDVIGTLTETALCRCGHSDHKPFCDGTHDTIGFRAE